MSIREVTMYQVACDAPDCKVSTPDLGGEFWAWSDTDAVEQNWEDCDGLATGDGKHYCRKHFAWCIDCESEEIPSYEGAPDKCAACTSADGTPETGGPQ